MTSAIKPAGQDVPGPDDQAAVAAVPGAIISAWARHDADAFADVFTDDATMILPGVFVQGKNGIREFMAAAFAGPYQGTRVVGEPAHLHFPRADVAVLVTTGGVLAPAEKELADTKAIRATWTLIKEDGTWRLTAYSNTSRDGD
ncbi:MAG TPA: SgcJ/EcaC family oxidoreductase [Amycolatopsis sp.]|nr:SgcJ/EcaC family oxidoreductase [Amycolatopsis sp.]